MNNTTFQFINEGYMGDFCCEYKIAVATSDGVNIDLHFGQTEIFTIYQVYRDGSYAQLEKRKVGETNQDTSCDTGKKSCGGCSGHRKNERVAMIADCRCVLCARCGAGTETELGKRKITSFVIEKRTDEALEKIIQYYSSNKIGR